MARRADLAAIALNDVDGGRVGASLGERLDRIDSRSPARASADYWPA
jgi:hypothetical protein